MRRRTLAAALVLLGCADAHEADCPASAQSINDCRASGGSDCSTPEREACEAELYWDCLERRLSWCAPAGYPYLACDREYAREVGRLCWMDPEERRILACACDVEERPGG